MITTSGAYLAHIFSEKSFLQSNEACLFLPMCVGEASNQKIYGGKWLRFLPTYRARRSRSYLYTQFVRCIFALYDAQICLRILAHLFQPNFLPTSGASKHLR